MELIKPGTFIDFMRYRRWVIGFSVSICILSAVLLVYPGPRYGTDFSGGTEVQIAFSQSTTAAELRAVLEESGYHRPDVVNVEGSPNEYLIRVQEVSPLSEQGRTKIEQDLTTTFGENLTETRISPGGDKITLRFQNDVDQAQIQTTLVNAGVEVRSVQRLASSAEPRYEAYLIGVGDSLLKTLRAKLGSKVPDAPRKIEWVGPKAGKQLRDAALLSMLYTIAFIMLYIAIRFDFRFAPGAVIAMLHDALFTIGVYIIAQKEVALTTVAAILTVIGYSVNDTIVIYDRIRENMAKHHGKSLYDIINISTSETLSRTIMTSFATALSVLAFFIWGTPVIQDISFALLVGIAVGTYSTIYVAAPVTEWMDKRLFAKPTMTAKKTGKT